MNRRPLVITEDRALLDDLVRIAAAAGAQLDVAHAPAHARPHWNLAPMVVVGADLADALAATAPPPRDRVLLVTHAADDPDTWRRCVAVGARTVIDLPASERRLVEEFADISEPEPRSGTLVCVIGGRGGAGASVLSAGLALHASGAHLRTLLLDADPLGGGIDALLGQEEAQGARWPDLVAREGRVSSTALRDALPAFGDLAVLSFHRGDPRPIPAEAMRSVLESGLRGFDLVIADLPRHIDQAAVEALTRAAGTLLVVCADVRGVLSAAQVQESIRHHTADIRLVSRPGAIAPDTISASLDGAPHVAQIPDHPRLDASLNRGEMPALGPRTPLGRLCSTLLQDLLPA
ncbi:septum site-determining protein Ssd [Nonomuraea sp. NPDC050663]|uniref:septum site-determining protein Ssd n=1 Tax=Nonomuraea sp. NPDC050663 TaxID=3364370 RepID=UPI0037B49EAE